MRLFRSRKDDVREEPEPPPITWTTALGSDTALDDAAREKLLGDMQLIGAAWCVPLLERAVEEERDQTLRDAAVRALETCRRQRF